MGDAVKMLFFAGSARAGSYNKQLARLGAMIAEANGIEATFADLEDYPMPLYNGDDEAIAGPPENAVQFKNLMAEHDAIFIACPEYNASITPLLKNTLDWVSRVNAPEPSGKQVYSTRVFALGAASPGGLGGLRGLPEVRHVLELELGALVLPDQFALPRAAEAFDTDGHLKNKDNQETLKALIQRLAHTARALRG